MKRVCEMCLPRNYTALDSIEQTHPRKLRMLVFSVFGRLGTGYNHTKTLEKYSNRHIV
jgi:hypothetical protein